MNADARRSCPTRSGINESMTYESMVRRVSGVLIANNTIALSTISRVAVGCKVWPLDESETA